MFKSARTKQITGFLAVLLALVFFNIIADSFFIRLDLTQDKRYTISKPTRQLLGGLKDVVYIEVYLEGDFPAGFERLQRSIRETLEEFSAYGGVNIQYKFTNPGESSDAKTRNEVYNQLAKKGLQPTNLTTDINGKREENIVFPGAIVSYGGKEAAVTLLKGNQAASPAERLNQSVEGVEYELATAIRKVTQPVKKSIAVIQGHGELDGYEFSDMGLTLREFYNVRKVNLPTVVSLDEYDAIIIAKPDSTFSEPDKFKIDQFIVKGGKALFFIDKLNVNLDSIGPNGMLALPYPLNLDDLFFKYGVRLNDDLVMDINSAAIPMVVGYLGDKPQTRLVPWRFYPLVNTFGQNAITRNMDAQYVRFAGSIDTVAAKGIAKTPLFSTGKYSRIITSPARINFNEARQEPQPAQYKRSYLPLAYLLEGSFPSLYTNRLAPNTESTFKFVEKDKPGKILVCSDGDLVRNDVNMRQQQSYPLGYDRYAGIQFGNKDFVLNAVSYMLDDEGVILARNKKIELRPLDKVKYADKKARWQVVNLLTPVLLVAVFGFGRAYLRKRKYTRFATVKKQA